MIGAKKLVLGVIGVCLATAASIPAIASAATSTTWQQAMALSQTSTTTAIVATYKSPSTARGQYAFDVETYINNNGVRQLVDKKSFTQTVTGAQTITHSFVWDNAGVTPNTYLAVQNVFTVTAKGWSAAIATNQQTFVVKLPSTTTTTSTTIPPTTTTSTTSTPTTTTTTPVKKTLVGLGDSMMSGYGSFDQAGPCGISPSNSPLSNAAADKSMIGVNVACQGATTDAFTNPFNTMPAQFSQLAQVANVSAVTVSIGYNDGYSSVPRDQLTARLQSAFADLKTRIAPGTPVLVVDYPAYNGPYVAGGLLTDTTTINYSVKTAAANVGFGFVDVIPAFTGHGAADAVPYMNGDTVTSGAGFANHPNAAGSKVIGDLIAAQLP